jgi:hypothetical protein
MSDIEDYVYSPYDDIEDILYDADPTPELADDLADHAIASPVYQDELAGFELQDYFSDWEYYSDDYVDDDPVLLKKNAQDAASASKPGGGNDKGKRVVKRGTKRKLADTLDITPLDPEDSELMARSIKGTIWAKPADHRPPSYKNGQDGKVALMKNWKEIFAITDDGWGRQGGETKDDESWAKDMSLADMGLQTAQRQSFPEDPEAPNSEFGNEDDEEEEEEEEAGAVTGQMDGADEDEDEDEADQAQEVVVVPDMKPTPDSATADPQPEDVDEYEQPRKKRRRFGTDRPSPDQRDGVTSATSTPEPASAPDKNVKGKDKAPQTRGLRSKQINVPSTNGPTSKAGRKRKATEEPDLEDMGASKSTASSRAKRVTSARG